MASLQVGFGANAPNVQNVGVMDTTIRLIQTQPGSFARITTITAAFLQLAGALVATVYAPIYVLRGGDSLGAGANPGQLAATGALVPTDPNLLGFPAVSQLTGNIELLFAQYVRLQNQGATIEFDGDELYASDGQRLAVVMGSLVDGSVSPPTVSTIQAANALSVLGEVGAVASRGGGSGFGGDARSLPRFDVSTFR